MSVNSLDFGDQLIDKGASEAMIVQVENVGTDNLLIESITYEGGILQFEGSKMLNMRDFEVEPPTAMLGLIRVQEHININFNLQVAIGGNKKG